MSLFLLFFSNILYFKEIFFFKEKAFLVFLYVNSLFFKIYKMKVKKEAKVKKEWRIYQKDF